MESLFSGQKLENDNSEIHKETGSFPGLDCQISDSVIELFRYSSNSVL
jgi:hypothetical protein